MVDISTIVLIIIFAIPHLFYAFVWTRPKMFQDFIRPPKHPVQAFAQVATLLKFVQLLALVVWLLLHPPVMKELPDLISIRTAICAGLILIGQILNIAIYLAIGHDGVYYGIRLGKPCPWHTGFPFSIADIKIPHPQYLGSVMTLWGVIGLFLTSTTWELVYVALASSIFYTLTAAIEDNKLLPIN